MEKNRTNTNIRKVAINIFSLLMLFTCVGFSQENPLPVLTDINPSGCELGTPGFTISIFGSNFTEQSAVNFNGLNAVSNYLSPSEMEAYIPGNYLNNVGTFEVTIVNPAPGGGISEVKLFSVYGSTQSISRISPRIMITNESDLSLVVVGVNLSTRSVVRFNGTNRSTLFNGSAHLIAQLEPQDLAVAGDYEITVLNTETGVITNPLTLSIFYPIPFIESIDPSIKNPGDGGFTLTVKGLNFVPFSKVFFDVDELPTTFVDSTTLTAEVSASYLIVPSSAFDVVVFTSGPGGGKSNSATFTISPEVSRIVSISPTRLKSGGISTSIRVEGTKFTENTVGKFNGLSRPTTYISSTLLMVSILESDLQKFGKYPITIDNNVSNGFILTIYYTKQPVGDDQAPTTNSILPENYFITNSYPNPFNPTTAINFTLPEASAVTIKVYNSLGQMISTLLDHAELNAGQQNVIFSANNLASGEYFYHIVADDLMGQHYSSIKKMILIK